MTPAERTNEIATLRQRLESGGDRAELHAAILGHLGQASASVMQSYVHGTTEEWEAAKRALGAANAAAGIWRYP